MFLFLMVSCHQPKTKTQMDYTLRGPYHVGHRPLYVDNLTAELWYPAKGNSHESNIPSAFIYTETDRAVYTNLLDDAPCASRKIEAGIDATSLSGQYPLVIFSHCHECTRFSSFSIAEHLASYGFLVAAADHDGNTLWDNLNDMGLPLNVDTLNHRIEQQNALLDAALQLEMTDTSRVGVFGHSFGSVTSGMIAQERTEVQAALGLAAPMENPLLPGVSIVGLDIPLGFLVAVEDNSITELGNTLIRDNFERANTAWKYEVEDAGHWSFSDIVGIIQAFEPGCGSDMRQTDGTEFEYLPAEQGRLTASAFTVAFFEETLNKKDGALDSLEWDIETNP